MYDLSADKQRAVMGYLYARMARNMAAASVGPIRLADVLGLLKAFGLAKDKAKSGGDMDALLGSVFGDDDNVP